MDYKD